MRRRLEMSKLQHPGVSETVSWADPTVMLPRLKPATNIRDGQIGARSYSAFSSGRPRQRRHDQQHIFGILAQALKPSGRRKLISLHLLQLILSIDLMETGLDLDCYRIGDPSLKERLPLPLTLEKNVRSIVGHAVRIRHEHPLPPNPSPSLLSLFGL